MRAGKPANTDSEFAELEPLSSYMGKQQVTAVDDSLLLRMGTSASVSCCLGWAAACWRAWAEATWLIHFWHYHIFLLFHIDKLTVRLQIYDKGRGAQMVFSLILPVRERA